MHEAGAVAGALDKVIGTWPASRKVGRLQLDIRDATRAEPGSVAFYATAILADRGLDDVTFSVHSRQVSCALCGCLASPTPANPSCDECGAPLPRLEGPAVVCREIA